MITSKGADTMPKNELTTTERARDVLDKHTAWNGHPTVQEAVDAMLAFAALTTESRPEGLAREELALRAIKAVTATTKDAVAGLSRIMVITRSAGVLEPYSELMTDPSVSLIVSEPRDKWRHLFERPLALASPQTDAPASGQVERLRALMAKAAPVKLHALGGYLGCKVDGRTIFHLDEIGQENPSAPFQAIPFARAADAEFMAALWNAAPALLSTPTPSEGARDSALEVERAANAIIGDLGDVNMDGYYSGVVHRSDVEHLERCLAALRTAKPEQAGAGEALRVALDRAVLFSAYNRNDPQAIRFVFRDDEDRLTAANAVDAFLAAPQGHNSGEGEA